MESIVTLIVGALICFFGVKNMMGDISSLHSYHRNHVSEEDRIPFGRLVDKGLIIIGVSVCLLGGPRKCKRYKTIKVQYQTLDMQTRTKNFTGWTAQIIQHEVDHCNGVLI